MGASAFFRKFPLPCPKGTVGGLKRGCLDRNPASFLGRPGSDTTRTAQAEQRKTVVCTRVPVGAAAETAMGGGVLKTPCLENRRQKRSNNHQRSTDGRRHQSEGAGTGGGPAIHRARSRSLGGGSMGGSK
ncbi:hypothetical protein NDU88_002060 [Pleurodeles waltl]|uniref:Uncharacterized protein n=1 Tax=Pleurodeles waltl TaxID=8319 RepID=A0AAV7UUL7_PLEWA|nr:hypothetical protein NDU88_002060 [Pleurodeles waltl]